MAEDEYARWAARVLSAARGHLEPRPDEDPGATVARLQEAIRATAGRRRRRAIASYSLAGAAAVAAVVLALSAPGGSAPPPVAHSTVTPTVTPTVTIEGRQALAAGATIETAESALTLLSSDGTRLVVGPHSHLRLTRHDVVRWFRLVSGAVSLQVSKLQAGHRFVVETPDREVEVKGTEFEVRVASPQELRDCELQTITRVIVEEGAVIVRGPGGSEAVIRAGGHWPEGCLVAGPAAQAVAPEVAPTRAAPAAAHPSPAPRSRASRPAPAVVSEPAPANGASTLAVENDLFSAAAHAERAGDRAGALRTLDELLLRYPASPLRDAALAERRKLTSGAARPAAP